MNSIKELKEQLGYEEIGLDDIFVFHCTQCGKCCIHREDILLSPKDLFHINFCAFSKSLSCASSPFTASSKYTMSVF